MGKHKISRQLPSCWALIHEGWEWDPEVHSIARASTEYWSASRQEIPQLGQHHFQHYTTLTIRILRLDPLKEHYN